MIDQNIRALLEAGKVDEAKSIVKERQEETKPEMVSRHKMMPNLLAVPRSMGVDQRKAAEDARIAAARAAFEKLNGKAPEKKVNKRVQMLAHALGQAPQNPVKPEKEAEVKKVKVSEDTIRAYWAKEMRAGKVTRLEALARINDELLAYGLRVPPGTPKEPDFHDTVEIQMPTVSEKGEKAAKMVELAYIVADSSQGMRVSRTSVESTAVARTAVQMILDGTTRAVSVERGVFLTLIHRDSLGQEYAVKRQWMESEAKAQAAGQKALMEGLPRRKTCPECKGMGRVLAGYGSTPCPECLKPCPPNKCGGPDCPKCDGGGEYGCGNVPDEPLMVHGFWSAPELRAQMVVGRHEGRLVDRGVLALEKPLPVDRVKPRPVNTGKGNYNRHPQWQRVGQTKVTFSRG